MTLTNRIADCRHRLDYLLAIKGESFRVQYDPIKSALDAHPDDPDVTRIETSVHMLEEAVARSFTPGDTVRLTRHPARITLLDILDHAFDDYVELGGSGDNDMDPAVLVAHAKIAREGTGAKYPVMVVGHQKGRGRNDYTKAGAATPEGNAKLIQFGTIAENEGIPLLLFANTPGAMHFEDHAPGASQQIANNISFLTAVRTPVIVINYGEGGSGGFEALGVGDYKLMLSRAWYSVISPESAAAIEHKSAAPTQDQIDSCARSLHLTADDCLAFRVIDRIIAEPTLGARATDAAFFDRLRYELVRAVDEVVLRVKSPLLNMVRGYRHRQSFHEQEGTFDREIGWALTQRQLDKLVRERHARYRSMCSTQFADSRNASKRVEDSIDRALLVSAYRIDQFFRYNKQLKDIATSIGKECVSFGAWTWRKLSRHLPRSTTVLSAERQHELQSHAGETIVPPANDDYESPAATTALQVSCPNERDGRHFSLWGPELFQKDGVCDHCGYHFPMEYNWYVNKVFDKGTVRALFSHIQAVNPMSYEGFDKRLSQARNKTGYSTAVHTFEAAVKGTTILVAMIYKDFIGGTIGAAEAEKITLALERAKLQKKPFLFYSHFCGGIRIYEGAVGLQAMAKCTFAARDYMDSGGLLLTVFDHNSYAGPVASFLSCTPYKFGIASSRIAFAGPRVIEASAKHRLPEGYQSVENALKRGQIMEIWSRTEMRDNLDRCLMTMGGASLYYR